MFKCTVSGTNVNHDQRQLLKGYLFLYSVFLKLLIPVKSVLKRRRQMFWSSWVLVGSTKIIQTRWFFLPCDEENDLQKNMNNTPNTVSTSLLIPNCGSEENIHLHVRKALMRQCLFMLFNRGQFRHKSQFRPITSVTRKGLMNNIT